MSYSIIDIEGVGEAYAKKLQEAGIRTTEALLDACASPKGRKETAAKTGIAEALLLKWANHADLFRITGIAGQFSELLEAAGVDTIKELRNRNAENLHAKMEEINAEKKLTRRIPSVEQLDDMIKQAGKLEPKMTY